MTFAGLLILASGFLLMTLASIPAVSRRMRGNMGNSGSTIPALAVLQNRDFRILWTVKAVHEVSRRMELLVLGYLILRLTVQSMRLSKANGLPYRRTAGRRQFEAGLSIKATAS